MQHYCSVFWRRWDWFGPALVTIPATVNLAPEKAGIAAGSEALLKLSYVGGSRFVRFRFAAEKPVTK